MLRTVLGVSATTMPDGTSVIMDATAEQVFELNEWASWAWAKLERGIDRQALVAAAVEEFDVSSEAASRDLDLLLADLLAAHLLEASPAAPSE